MFVPRENNPNRKEWIDEEYEEADYKIFPRESGDFEVYQNRTLIAKVESIQAGIEVIREHRRDA